jgi:hypothetical protein
MVLLNGEQKSLEILNGGLFSIIAPGPLHNPVRKFSISRDENLRLILETEAALNAVAVSGDQPDGVARFKEPLHNFAIPLLF